MGAARTETRQLVKYEAACRALAAARSTDEVRAIRDTAAALKVYARQAKNKQLEIDAAEIRIRAERRIGELMQAQRETEGLNAGAKGRGSNQHKVRIATGPTPPTLADAGIDKHLADRARKLAAMPHPAFEARVAEWRETVAQDSARVNDRLLVHLSSESPEHYTPPAFLDAVREVFGDIPDLDPCSNVGTPNVPARQHYTSNDNGLEQPWHGRVFLNPPYGRAIADWIMKLRAEWVRPEVREIIALLPGRIDTEWFDTLTADTDDAIVCFLRGRLTFVGNNDPAPFPSIAVYFGPRHDVFADVFLGLGSLWQRPAAPREWFVNHE